MEVILKKRPKNVIILEAFPGFGLIGTITTEFLINHLNVEKIGYIMFKDMPPIVTLHENKLVEPFAIYYNKKYNLVILHAIMTPKNYEWKIAESINKLAKELDATRIISVEGIFSFAEISEPKIFYYTNDKQIARKFKADSVRQLKEGIILGVTAALMLKAKVPITCLFAETTSQLPDSKAAAKIIELIDQLFGFNIEYKPLLEVAEKFEEKLKSMISKAQQVSQEHAKKEMPYVG